MRIGFIGLLAAGLAAILFGSVWLTAVFPGLKQIPADYNQTIDFQGTYAVLAEQDFLQQLLANPSVQRVVSSPQTLLLLARPETQQILGSDVLKTLLTNPTLLQQLVANPSAVQQIADPTLKQFFANPTVQALLGDRVIVQLLADPTGLKLITDPRTLRLLADPTSLKLQEIPVNLHRVRTAKQTQGDTLFLDQDFSATVRGTGQPLPQFSSKSALAVHRTTRLYVPGGSEPRSGGFALPFDVKKEREYSIWVHEVYQPLTAKFVQAEEVLDLNVYTFQIRGRGLPLPNQAKKVQGLSEALDLAADVDITMKTEPKTGITVTLESSIKYNLKNPVLGNPTVFRASIRDSDQSVATSVNDARDVRRLLFWLGTFLPWSVLGLGIVLTVVGGGLLAVTVRRKATQSV